ncbi:MAG: 50S ribosomal protein L21 [Cyanobacteria bacterium]|nr:50S ribosomal protein L21 [Cyanobacteriota bacterium]
MYAVVDINGKQYPIQEGRYLDVDRLNKEPNEKFDVSSVLLVAAGEHSLVGAPYIAGATATATVVKHLRGPKLLVYKMRCKKGYRRKNGHRQEFTRIMIDSLNFPGKANVAVDVFPEAKPRPAAKSVPTKGAEAKPAKAAAVEAVTEEKPVAKKKPAATAAKKTVKKTATAKEAGNETVENNQVTEAQE